MDDLNALLEQLTPAQRGVVQKSAQNASARIKRLEMKIEHQRLAYTPFANG